MGWLRETMLAEGKVNTADLELIYVTDDVEETAEIMAQARRRHEAS